MVAESSVDSGDTSKTVSVGKDVFVYNNASVLTIRSFGRYSCSETSYTPYKEGVGPKPIVSAKTSSGNVSGYVKPMSDFSFPERGYSYLVYGDVNVSSEEDEKWSIDDNDVKINGLEQDYPVDGSFTFDRVTKIEVSTYATNTTELSEDSSCEGE